jgi:hypothetical protein
MPIIGMGYVRAPRPEMTLRRGLSIITRMSPAEQVARLREQIERANLVETDGEEGEDGEHGALKWPEISDA